jgi:hypothetical protein
MLIYIFFFVGCGLFKDEYVGPAFEDGVHLCQEIEEATGDLCDENPDECVEVKCLSDLIGYICSDEVFEMETVTTISVLDSMESACEDSCNDWKVLDCSESSFGDETTDFYNVACDHHCGREK